MSKRLFIDLKKCDECKECIVDCVYFYRAGDKEHGIISLRELAAFMLICRRCEEPSCVKACKFDALERGDDGVLRRHNMRCVSCKSCVNACPFGTIYPETVPFYAARCDYCLGSADGAPVCVSSCEKHAIEYREVQESEKEGISIVNDHLAIRAPRWNKKDV